MSALVQGRQWGLSMDQMMAEIARQERQFGQEQKIRQGGLDVAKGRLAEDIAQRDATTALALNKVGQTAADRREGYEIVKRATSPSPAAVQDSPLPPNLRPISFLPSAPAPTPRTSRPDPAELMRGMGLMGLEVPSNVFGDLLGVEPPGVRTIEARSTQASQDRESYAQDVFGAGFGALNDDWASGRLFGKPYSQLSSPQNRELARFAATQARREAASGGKVNADAEIRARASQAGRGLTEARTDLVGVQTKAAGVGIEHKRALTEYVRAGIPEREAGVRLKNAQTVKALADAARSRQQAAAGGQAKPLSPTEKRMRETAARKQVDHYVSLHTKAWRSAPGGWQKSQNKGQVMIGGQSYSYRLGKGGDVEVFGKPWDFFSSEVRNMELQRVQEAEGILNALGTSSYLPGVTGKKTRLSGLLEEAAPAAGETHAEAAARIKKRLSGG